MIKRLGQNYSGSVPLFTLSVTYCQGIALYFKGETNQGGVALSLLASQTTLYTNAHCVSNSYTYPQTRLFLLIFQKGVGNVTHQETIRSGRIIVSHILRCGNFVLLSASLGLMQPFLHASPQPTCAVYWKIFGPPLLCQRIEARCGGVVLLRSTLSPTICGS